MPDRPPRPVEAHDLACLAAREVVSARLDGEAVEPSTSVDAHLATCDDCMAFARQATDLHRRVRVAPAPAVPDLTDRILAAAPAPATTHRSGRRDQARLVLGMAGVAQVAVAVAGLFAAQPVHAVREVAAFEIALGIAMVIAAWRPGRFAHGMLPLVGLAAAIVLGAAVVDVAGGAAGAVAEFSHLVPAIGAAVLWWLDRGVSAPPVRLHAGPA